MAPTWIILPGGKLDGLNQRALATALRTAGPSLTARYLASLARQAKRSTMH